MRKKKTVAIIPARLDSSRFPGKPLKKILDLPLIEHVRRRVCLCDAIDDVYVATCDDRIRDTVEACGGKVLMTSIVHERCTDRVEEAAGRIDAEIILNVQGDEPLILPETLKEILRPFKERENIQAACLIYPVTHDEDLNDINAVKAVLNRENFVIYFSRSPIPNFKRGERPKLYKQSGIMAYNKKFLHKLSGLSRTPLEKAESVDMLRIIEHGFQIYGVVTENVTIGVDIPEHIRKVEDIIMNDSTQKEFYERIVSR